MATSESLQWTHHYAAVYQISEAEGSRKERKRTLAELLVADGDELGRPQSDLKRVMDTLQRELLRKPIYLHASNPTSRLLTFLEYDDGRPNQSRERLDLLLAVADKDALRAHAGALAEQYLTIPNIRAGVLIFLVSEPPVEKGGRCAFVFKCDFEAISQIDRRHFFDPVDHAIVETTKKAAIYPYFIDGQLDPATVRVFDEQGKTQYWLDFLELGKRTPMSLSHQQATIARLRAEISEKYADQLESPRPARPLDKRRRFVEEEDRLTPDEADRQLAEITRETTEAKVTLRLDELSLTAPAAQYTHTWVIAEEGDERYVVLKGDTLENRTRSLTMIDFVDFEAFKEAVRRLGIRCD